MSRCLGERVADYVDGRLDADTQLTAERHLVACQFCCSEVALERRVRETLRSAPVMPSDLMATLLSVSQEIPVRAPAASQGRRRSFGAALPPAWVPAPPTAPTSLGFAASGSSMQLAPDSLRVLGPSAPAQHRSALRSAAFATAAAGASMVALWAFSMSPAATAVRTGPAAAVPSRPATQAPAPTTGPATTMVVLRSRATQVPGQAQSTP